MTHRTRCQQVAAITAQAIDTKKIDAAGVAAGGQQGRLRPSSPSAQRMCTRPCCINCLRIVFQQITLTRVECMCVLPCVHSSICRNSRKLLVGLLALLLANIPEAAYTRRVLSGLVSFLPESGVLCDASSCNVCCTKQLQTVWSFH